MERGRQTVDMHHSASADHARHDRTLIAGHAAGDLQNLDIEAAANLIATCDPCADLHRDLTAISAATRALPRTARAPRDFRITAEQAARLRSGSWLRSLVRPFASARSATRPLAAAFTSLGVAGLLVAVVVPGLLGGAASAPQTRELAGEGQTSASLAPDFAGQAAGPTVAAEAPGAATAASDDNNFVKDADSSNRLVAAGAGASPSDVELMAAGDGSPTETDLHGSAGSSPSNVLLLGSIGLLLVGLAMYGLRFAARRLR